MVSKHCAKCGVEAHPRLCHPSSLRVEVAVWSLAVMVGLGAGMWSAVTSRVDSPINETLQTFALSSAQQAPAQPVTVAGDPGQTRGPAGQMTAWVLAKTVSFLRTAWWVLPLPILFSLWRQSRHYEVCPACGSRALIPVLTPHGQEPPV